MLAIPLHLASALLASPSLSLVLLPTALVAAADLVSAHSLSRPTYVRHRRRAQGDDDEGEWYLPDLEGGAERTWLFGAGDPSEWGSDAQVEDPTVPTPINVPSLSDGEYVVGVSAGGLHSAIVTSEGRILTAGSSAAGGDRGLGRETNGGRDLTFLPVTEVSFESSSLPRFTKVVASQDYTFALDESGRVWATGNNAYGQLCMGDAVARDRFHQVMIPGNGNQIVDISLGERHTFLLKEDGRVWGCGWNAYGQLGIGLKGDNALDPVEIIIDAPDEDDEGASEINHEVIRSVVAGRGSSYFLTASGHVYATGTNYEGQLCLGHRDDRLLPTALALDEKFLSGGSDFSLMDVESIAAGKSSFYLKTNRGHVLACGIGSEDSQNVPEVVLNNVNAIFSGPLSLGAFLVGDQVIYSVGFNGAGDPNAMACVNEEDVMISAGNDHHLYLTSMETAFDCEGVGLPELPQTMTSPPTSSSQTKPTSSPSITPPPSLSSSPSRSMPTTSPAPSTVSKPPVAPPRQIDPNTGSPASRSLSGYGLWLFINFSLAVWQLV